VYSSAGSYTVGLTVTGAGGSDTETKSNYVTVTAPTAAPVAGFSGTPTSGVAPLTVNFSNSSTGSIVTYAWDFGDGTSSSVQNPSHAYSAAGSYTVKLTVTGAGGSNTKISNNYVTVSAPPTTTGAPKLTGSIVSAAGTVDLTNVGTSDWVQWPGKVRKATGGGQINDVVHVGTGSAATYANDPRTVKWSDGTPTATGSTSTGISMSGTGNGFQISAPADTTTRTLTLYLGALNATGTLTAHLSDGSAVDFVSSYGVRYKWWDGVCTLTYRAASAGQTITVKWIKKSGNGTRKSASLVSLQGAGLSGTP
jgi:PKD repeat protein